MGSAQTGDAGALTSHRRRRLFQQIIRTSLPAHPYMVAAADPRRQWILNHLLRTHFEPSQDRRILHVGCGPFALEVLCETVQRCQVTAFDYIEDFGRTYLALRRQGLLRDVDFFVGDIRTISFRPRSFDLIIFHDVFYELKLSADDIIARYADYLVPGGLLYADLLDARAKQVWSLFGLENAAYRRYQISSLLARLESAGLRVVAREYLMQNRNFAKRAVHQLIMLMTGISNGYGFLMVKL